jgi:nitrite reductase (NADH) large subunit
VATQEETIDVIKAITQAYRENARYLDRIYKWMGKVGMDWIKERVVEDLAERTALVERFELSQSLYRRDPWADHVRDKSQSYQALASIGLEAAE